MGWFLIRFIIALILAVTVLYFITGVPDLSFITGEGSGLPKSREVVEKWGDMIKSAFPNVSSWDDAVLNAISEGVGEGSPGLSSAENKIADVEEEDTSFFKQLLEKIKPALSLEKETPAEKAFKAQSIKLPPHNIACFPTFQLSCEMGRCSDREPGANFILLNDEAGVMAKCGTSGCDTYQIEHGTLGKYERYQLTVPVTTIITRESAQTDGAERMAYVEVTIDGVITIIRSGLCSENQNSN